MRKLEQRLGPYQKFNKAWFKKNQRPLLYLANSPFAPVRHVTRRALRIERHDCGWKENICEIGPNHVFRHLGRANGLDRFKFNFYINQKFSEQVCISGSFLWKLLHAWDMRFANRLCPALNMGFDDFGPLYPDAGSGGITVDGIVYLLSLAGLSWAEIHDAASGNAATGDAWNTGVQIDSDNEDGKWNIIARWIATLDTSSMLATSTVVTAALYVRGHGKHDGLGITPRLAPFSASPADDNNLVAGDYDCCGTDWLTDSSITYSGFSTSGYNHWTFNSVGIAEVDPGGITRVSVRETDNEAANVEPAWSASQTSDFEWYNSDNGSLEPYLEGTFTRAAIPGGLFYALD